MIIIMYITIKQPQSYPYVNNNIQQPLMYNRNRQNMFNNGNNNNNIAMASHHNHYH